MNKTMRILLQLCLWNVIFIIGFVALVVSVGRNISEMIGVSVPYILGVWLLVLGTRFAHTRTPVIAITIIASLLLLLQCAVFGFFIWYNLGFPNTEKAMLFEFLLLAATVTGGLFVWWFTGEKLQRPDTGN